MTTHRLKVLIKYADAIMNGTKTFEVRKNDRGYRLSSSCAQASAYTLPSIENWSSIATGA